MKMLVFPGDERDTPEIYFSFIREEVFDAKSPPNGMWRVALADAVIMYNVSQRQFNVRKSREFDPEAITTCCGLVKKHLEIDVTIDGKWINPADETMFLLKYNANSNK